MKIFSIRTEITYCDPIAYGPCCWETKDPDKWHDHKGNQQIWQKFKRTREEVYLWGIRLYTKSMKDEHTHWYWFWDLGPMYLPPEKTKEPGQYMLRLKRIKDSESPFLH